MTRRDARTLPAALLAALAACASGGQNYHDKAMDFGSVRTVAVMPIVNLSRDNLAGERVRDVITTMMLASGAFYVVPQGEVIRVATKAGITMPATPTVEDVVRFGTMLKVDAVITGTVKEYGEVRAGSATGNVISLSLTMQECATGKIVWTGTTTRGGVTWKDRLLGGGGAPLNEVTETAVDDLLSKLFK
jgi:hypothetical protein